MFAIYTSDDEINKQCDYAKYSFLVEVIVYLGIIRRVIHMANKTTAFASSLEQLHSISAMRCTLAQVVLFSRAYRGSECVGGEIVKSFNETINPFPMKVGLHGNVYTHPPT